MSRLAVVFGLYALTVSLAVALLASLFVAPMAKLRPLFLVIITAFLTMIGSTTLGAILDVFRDPDGDAEPEPGRGRLLFLPLACSIVAAAPAMLVAENEPVVRSFAHGVSPIVVQLGAAMVALVVVVLVALPLAVRRKAWQRIDEFTIVEPSPGASPRNEGSRGPGIGTRFAADRPERLDVREVKKPAPAVYLFDDGRRAVLAFTSGALEALADREREAVVARELARVVERAAVPQFWASALALGVTVVVDPVATEAYAARAGGKVRLPFWVVRPVKLVAAVLGLFVLFVVYVWTLSTSLPVSGPTLTVAYAIGTVLVAFGLARAASHLARHVATTHVLTADEHGAILADDTTALASALRTLSDAQHELGADDDTDALGALDVLADCPTDRVPLDDRLDALDDVAERLEERRSDRPADATAASASS